MDHARLAVGLWLALCTWGCGAASPSREARLNEGFARIQRHEARIERERSKASGDDCEAACQAAGALCAEHEALCELARELEDADALTRCDQAAQSCRGTRSRTAERCGCGDG